VLKFKKRITPADFSAKILNVIGQGQQCMPAQVICPQIPDRIFTNIQGPAGIGIQNIIYGKPQLGTVILQEQKRHACIPDLNTIVIARHRLGIVLNLVITFPYHFFWQPQHQFRLTGMHQEIQIPVKRIIIPAPVNAQAIAFSEFQSIIKTQPGIYSGRKGQNIGKTPDCIDQYHIVVIS
jgi:hypothetical protein